MKLLFTINLSGHNDKYKVNVSQLVLKVTRRSIMVMFTISVKGHTKEYNGNVSQLVLKVTRRSIMVMCHN